MDRARGLAADDDALVTAPQLAGLEAQARVEAREALHVAEVVRPPLLVAHEQQRELGEQLGALGERAQRAEREHVAALHVDGAGADELLTHARERLVLGVGDDGVVVADEQHLARAGALQADDEILGVAGARARHALERRIVGRERGAQRRALVRAVHVTGRRRDGHERFELARRAARDLGRSLLDPRIHAVHVNVDAVPELPEMEITARRLAEALPGETIESILTPGLNVLKTFDPPLSALDGAAFTGVRRRGKLLLLEADTRVRTARSRCSCT